MAKYTLLTSSTPVSLSDVSETLLLNRKITEPDRGGFFSPAHPFELSYDACGLEVEALEAATEILLAAILSNKKVVVYGDYDADGISATAVIWRFLHDLGAQITPFIPQRDMHGYGLSVAGIKDLVKTSKPDLIITVDNGIVAFEAVEYAKSCGITVLITDHHQPGENLPAAESVVFSTKLCGTTVAWMWMRYVWERARVDEKYTSITKSFTPSDLKLKLQHELDLCGLATISDQVPLLEANRSFAYHGLNQMNQTQRPGIKALLKITGQNDKKLGSHQIHYNISPRINAAGRLGDGTQALRLLCTKSDSKAEELAHSLQLTNVERQELTEKMMLEARLKADVYKDDGLILVASDQFHEGIIGLVAGRLMEEFHKPVLVVAIKDQVAKGSARSISQVNIIDLLRVHETEFIELGGHPMAAGFSIETSKIDTVRQLLLEQIQKLETSLGDEEIDVECELPHNLVSLDVVTLIEQFEPFGKNNPIPLFLLKEVTLLDLKYIGKNNEHLKLVLQLNNTGASQTALWWRPGDKGSDLLVEHTYDVIAQTSRNVWNGRSSVQLEIREVFRKD